MAVLGVVARLRAGRQLPGDGSENYSRGEHLPVCPRCGGTLAPHQRRCPGCGSRMVAGVLLRKAAGLTALGAIVGAIGGAVVTSNLLPLHPAPAPAAAAAALATSPAPTGQPPSPSPVSSAAASVPPVPSALPLPVAVVPPTVVPALRQVVAINDRMAAARRDLAALVRSGAKAPDLVVLLRRIAGDASSATQLLQRFRVWKGGARLATDLTAFYNRLGLAAGGTASLSNDKAYSAIARETLSVLDDLGGLATRTRSTLKSASAGTSAP